MDLEEQAYEHDPEYKEKVDKALYKMCGINNKEHWDKGYVNAREVIAAGTSAQDALKTALEDINQNDFNKGWIKACEDLGAIHEEN